MYFHSLLQVHIHQQLHFIDTFLCDCRHRRSVKRRELNRCRERQQGEIRGEKDEAGNGGVTRHPLEDGSVAVREGDTHNMDDTTTRITSLLQRIDGEERAGDG